jgi:type I restriction enzyme S subunit
MNGNLPDGWAWAKLGEVTKINGRDVAIRDLPDDLSVTFLPMAAVDAEQGYIAQPEIRPLKEVRKGFTPFSDGDVLLAKITPSMENGKAAIARKLQNGRGFGSTEFHVFRPKEAVTAKWVFHFIRQEMFRKDAKAHFAGTAGQLRVPASFLVDYPVPVPPLFEQERIVAKIEELFTQLDAGTAALKSAQAGLKRYKASVLKAAFTGNLRIGEEEENAQELLKRIMQERNEHRVAEVRARGKDPKKLVYEKLEAPNADELPSLPVHWTWATWEMILAYEDGAFRRGPFGSTLKKSFFVKSGYKVYEQYCPINDDCSFVRYYITPELFEELTSFEVKPGDYLISCSGVTLGRITRVPENSEKGIINQALLRVRINDKIIDHKYFLHYFRSPFFQERLFDSSTGTAIPNVKGVKELKVLPFPLPPLTEQRRIVAEVERRLEGAAQVESALAAALGRASRLRQAVLKSAFEGRLA